MCRMIGYLRTLRQYVRSVKGRRDTFDYIEAAATFFLLTLIVLIALSAVR